MGKNKRTKYIYNNEDYLDDSNDDYHKFFDEIRSGSLDKVNIETMNTEFHMSDSGFAAFDNGVPSDTYVESHNAHLEDLEWNSSSEEINYVKHQYLVKHNDHLDEQVIKLSKKTEETNIISNIDFNTVEGKTEQRIPFDYLVKEIFLKKRTVRCCGGNVFLYNEEYGCYEEQNEYGLHIAIRKSLTPEMDMKLGKYKISDVVHRIISSPELQINYDDFDRHTHLINFKNCVFDLNNWKSYAHNPDLLFTSYIDANYRKSSSHTRIYDYSPSKGYYFLKFLEDCTEGDPLKIKSIQQLTGYIISNEWRAKKFFVLLGLPHTGKSVWLSLWRSLIGPKHTTAMSLKQLGETRFMTAELFRSKLNITAEMDENGAIKGTDVIKMITGGDLLTAEKKGKDPFQFYGKTKLVAAGNHMPLLNKLDGTSAFTDRILFLMFNNTIPEERRNKSLTEKLMTEKDYIVKWALEGLQELRENNLIFTESEDALEFKRQYINELNNVIEFIQDRCEIDPNNNEYKIHRIQLYSAYITFCRDNGVKALSKEEFYMEVRKQNVRLSKFRINSSPLWGFKGIKLKTEFEENTLGIH